MYRVLVQHPPKPKVAPVNMLPPKLRALYDMIVNVADAGEVLLSGRDLGAVLGVSAPRVSQMLDRLCNDGFLSRQPILNGPRDGRRNRYVFRVTATGKVTA